MAAHQRPFDSRLMIEGAISLSTRRFRSVVLFCAFVFVGLMGTSGATGVAQAAPADAQALLTARFKNLATEMRLEVRDESYDEAAVVQQFKCKGGQNQVFGVGSNDVGGTAFSTRRSYKCVEPRDGTYDGAGVQ
ncbi:RICIN domain-containing protein [Streptomyces sp. NBC_01456]|uniref:RICIN domain-containing protein n=1 Tax=unclassified Streptomyces TaxID=2593676 RepID=UPI002E34E95D|nr:MULTISPECIES: RICIN domain-containing protein [unclassified Streptomyces]